MRVFDLMILETRLVIFSCMPTTLSSGVALTQVLHELIFLFSFFFSIQLCFHKVLCYMLKKGKFGIITTCWWELYSCSCNDCDIQFIRHFNSKFRLTSTYYSVLPHFYTYTKLCYNGANFLFSSLMPIIYKEEKWTSSIIHWIQGCFLFF